MNLPVTKHYKSMQDGLRPYFKDPNYATYLDCLSHIVYDLLIWIRNTGGNQNDMIVALRMAHEKNLAWSTDKLEWLEKIMNRVNEVDR